MNSTPKPLKTRQDIAEELGVSIKTIQRRLKQNDLKLSRNVYLSKEEQDMIYALFSNGHDQ